MVAVKTGLAPPPMMPQQPMNMMPPPMPVPMQFGQQPVGSLPAQAAGTAPVPVNARRRKRFGDSLETMLASRRPPVASDQMGDMNVFTGQMMNTAARPPVVQMRGGGNVGDMYRKAYSSPAFTSYTSSKAFSRPSNVKSRGSMTHDQLMDKIRGGSSPGDDRPAPAPVVPTPTSDPLDAFGGSGPDISADPNYVSDGVGFKYDPVVSGGTGTSGLPPIPLNEIVVTAPSEPSAPVGSGMNPSNVYVDPLDPFGGPGPDVSIPSMQFGDQPAGALPMDPDFYDPRNDFGPTNVAPLSAANIDLPEDVANALSNLGLGDTSLNPPERPVGGGQTGTGEEDDMTIKDRINKMIKDFAAVPGNILRDFGMGIDAGFYGNDYDKARANLRNAKNPDGSPKYTPDQIEAWVEATKITKQRQKDMQGQSTTEDGTVGGVGAVVDPCPPGFTLDPVSGICVPIEEAEEEGPSLDLNRTRDDEFNELDDIMKRIVKPAPEKEFRIQPVMPMRDGGSVGLNRVADNFLAAMGG